MTELALAQAPSLRRVNAYLLAGALLTSLALAVSFIGIFYSPYAPAQVDLLHRLAPPSLVHLLGTDRFGRDVLSRVLAGGWRSMTLGFGATALGLAIGLPIALATGYFRGRVDQVVMRFVDALLSIPTLVFALLIIVGLGPGQLQAILALGVAASPKFVRIVRGAALDAASQDYVTAARARGEGALYIQYGEVLPNIWPPVIVEGSINVGFALMGGAALSYLGLGTQPPYADWGVMINEAQKYISVSFWPLLGPALAICLSIVGFNLFGEGLRDRLHLKGKLGDA
jgi:peptide/nickel transport system permease protein